MRERKRERINCIHENILPNLGDNFLQVSDQQAVSSQHIFLGTVFLTIIRDIYTCVYVSAIITSIINYENEVQEISDTITVQTEPKDMRWWLPRHLKPWDGTVQGLRV